MVVVGGDLLIAAAAIYGAYRLGQDTGQTVAILTSAFTAIGTMSAAYFGIRAVTNTAQSAVAQQPVATVVTTPPQTAEHTAGGAGGADGPKPDEAGGPYGRAPGGTAGGVTQEPALGGAQDVAIDEEPETKRDRPVDEPEGATQDDQYQLIRETGNDRQDMTEEEEASHLQAEFGAADQRGIYGAPKGDE